MPTDQQSDQPTNLTQLARRMLADLPRTGRPQEQTIIHPSLDQPCQLIYRYGPHCAHVQIVTIIWAKQPAKSLQDELRTAFNIPWTVEPKFDYQNGYGIMRITWSANHRPPAQAYLFDALPAESRAGTYYEEGN